MTFDIRQYLEKNRHWPLTAFILKYGRTYPVGPNTFKHGRDKKDCYFNAVSGALSDNRLTYVEGMGTRYSVAALPHAWCVDADGFVVELTFPENRKSPNVISEYFGVPFQTDYVRVATRCNGNRVDGLLTEYSHLTRPALLELGLDEGQAWLLNAVADLRA